jgi:hypothetical protein
MSVTLETINDGSISEISFPVPPSGTGNEITLKKMMLFVPEVTDFPVHAYL